MINPNQAKLILSHCEPFIMNEMLEKPVTQIHICMTPDTLSRLGIKEEQLRDYAGGMYDGTDYHKGKSKVHVFDKGSLEKLAGSLWADYENARKEALKALEIGG